MAGMPPLPPGFTLDQPNQDASGQMPPLPPGFTLDSAQTQGRPPPVTAMNRVNAAAGGFNTGVAGILGLPMDTMQNIIDLGKAGIGSAYIAATGKAPPSALEVNSRENLIGSGAWIRNQLNKAGGAAELPRPDDPASRYLFAGGQGAAGAMIGPATGVPMVPSLTTNVAGSLSSQLAAEHGAGPGGQILAGMAGGALANVARAGIAEGVKRSFRGGEAGRQRTADNIQAFEDAGTTPSVGQATGNRRMQATESLLSKTPGGAGVMSATAEGQAADIGAGLERQAATLAPRSSAEQAGRAINQGVEGFSRYVAQGADQLYTAVDQHIPADTPIAIANTQRYLNQSTAPIAGAQNTSDLLANNRMIEIRDALGADLQAAQNGQLPYQAVRALRTRVGETIANAGLVTDVPTGQLRRLYGTLSADLEAAAQQQGPDAARAATRANNFYRAGMRRLDILNSVVDRNGGPERVFQAAVSGTKEGATTLRAVMQSLPEDGQRMVTATVLRRLGRALPGQQNELGERFSTETFLTNWNAMSPEAKSALFNRYGPDFRQNMDQVSRVAANLRAGSKVFQNPSGTGQATALATTAGAAAMAVLTGNPATAGAIGAGVGAANLSARLLTHPPFVRWLATATRAPANALPSLALQLSQRGNADEKAFAQQLQEQAPQQP
jgi:hypothetical protein